jgi:hypothetical protein
MGDLDSNSSCSKYEKEVGTHKRKKGNHPTSMSRYERRWSIVMRGSWSIMRHNRGPGSDHRGDLKKISNTKVCLFSMDLISTSESGT